MFDQTLYIRVLWLMTACSVHGSNTRSEFMNKYPFVKCANLPLCYLECIVMTSFSLVFSLGWVIDRHTLGSTLVLGDECISKHTCNYAEFELPFLCTSGATHTRAYKRTWKRTWYFNIRFTFSPYSEQRTLSFTGPQRRHTHCFNKYCKLYHHILSDI